ncbi:MAG: VWA domain-containing protein, partial [Planctomycetota bacterium]
AERFLEDLRGLYPARSAGDHAQPAGATVKGHSLGAARELSLRASAIFRKGMESRELGRVSAQARMLLLEDVKASGEAVNWAIAEVVAWDSSTNADRRPDQSWRPSTRERRVMISILVEAKAAQIRGALLAITRRKNDPLRSTALRLLARWASEFEPDEAVDLFLVNLLGRTSQYRDGPHPMTVLLERIQSVEQPLGPRAQAALQERIAQLLIASDWRKAAIGLRLSAGLSVANQIPMLLDGLNVWHQRSLAKRTYTSLVRIRGDLTRALQRLSGLKHGPEPRPWISWWVSVQQGKSPMPGTPEFDAQRAKKEATPRSTAGFFGLKPTSDRVTFIIDHSGSMDVGWGTTERTRYEEAIEQMLRFLQGAPAGTMFNVILFDDVPLRSSLGLVEATPGNLERARRSLLARSPGGGTHLRPAVELALGIGPDGLPAERLTEPETLPNPQKPRRGLGPRAGAGGPKSGRASDGDGDVFADTIVVLCDGETQGGIRWVEPLLTRVLPLYPVVFHTVHLGPNSDGVLRKLSEISGGDFLRVGS